ncbi:MAG: sucrase ferredoxin [Jatrophihabitans sp.]
MAERPERCRLRASERGDPMLGTAFPAARILLVEQPGGWGPAGLAASQFDGPTAARLIEGLGRQGIRVLAVRRPGRQPESRRRSWGLADCRLGRQQLVWGSFGADAELLDLQPDFDVLPAGAVRDDRPVYAVCAHGTHDMCCAIEGRPVAAALQRLVPGRAWECSHVGGDRFAANVLVLPTGQQYGRVSEAAELVAATEAGRTVPDLLRGQVGLAPPAQAAVVQAQRELDVSADQLRVLSVGNGEDGSQLVRLSSPLGELTVAVLRQAGAAELLTCRAAGPRTPLSYRPLWLRREGTAG